MSSYSFREAPHLLVLLIFLSENPSFQELIISYLKSFKIASSDCVFTRINDGCSFKYKADGTCSLLSVISQLFPRVNVEESTDKFIVPAKFNVGRIEVFVCPDHPSHGNVSFVTTSSESVEIALRQLTLGANTRLKLSWNFLNAFDPEKLEVKLSGFTSIGKIILFFLILWNCLNTKNIDFSRVSCTTLSTCY